MSCYLRHLRSLFDTLDLEYDKENRSRVDAAIREVLAVPDEAACPEVWSAVKALADPERDALPALVAEALARESQ